MARAFGQRPSVLLGVAAESYLAFCVDRAVWYFGTSLESDMQEAENALDVKANREQRIAARQRVFDAYMQEPGDESSPAAPPKGRFADPMDVIRAKANREVGAHGHGQHHPGNHPG